MIPRMILPAVWLMDVAYSRIAEERFQNLDGCVSRAIINDQKLKISVGLIQYTLHCQPNKSRAIIGRQNDTDSSLVIHHFAPFSEEPNVQPAGDRTAIAPHQFSKSST